MKPFYKIIEKNNSLRFAIELMSKNSLSTLFITNKQKICGVFSEGDFRETVLKEINLDVPIFNVMNKKFKFLYKSSSDKEITEKFKKNNDLIFLPIIDRSHKILDVIYRDNFITLKKRDNEAKCVIMAGGLGSRLNFLTKVLPKPLIPIGDKPIIEIILDKFCEQGFRNFVCILNYKSNLVRSYLREIKKNIKITSVTEKTPLGTAGGLRYLQNKIKKDFFLTNCDVTLDFNYDEVLNFHKKSKNLITVVAVLEKIKFSYGVFKSNAKGKVLGIQEKPELNNLINSGFYVINPKVFKFIPKNKSFEMNELIELIIKKKRKISLFPVNSQVWKDFGNLSNLSRYVKDNPN